MADCTSASRRRTARGDDNPEVHHEDERRQHPGDPRLRRRPDRRRASVVSFWCGCCSSISPRARRSACRRNTRSPLARTSALPPEPRLQTDPREDLRELRAQRRRAARQLRLGRPERGHRADPDRRGDAADAGARAADATGQKPRRARHRVDTKRHRGCRLSQYPGLRVSLRVLCVLCDLCVLCAGGAARRRWRWPRRPPGFKREAGTPSSQLPAPLREIGFDQHLDEHLPLDTPFRDEQGRAVQLGEYFGKRPVVLVFAYYDCPMLCTLVINGLSSALGRAVARPGQGLRDRHGQLRPARHAGAGRGEEGGLPAALQARRAPPAAGTSSPATSRRSTALTKAAGFRYAWDAETKQFAHPTGIIVADARRPDGALPVRHRVRPARSAAGASSRPRPARSASPVDALLLYCYHYDPMTGRYGLAIMRAMRIAGAATVLALGGFIVVMLRRERRTPSRTLTEPEPQNLEPAVCGPERRSSPNPPRRWRAASTRSTSFSSRSRSSSRC